jgi:hypothetical protein
MKNKIDIEEIKQLIPDYITGKLNDNQKNLVDTAMMQSDELRDFYLELKATLDFTGSVPFKEPAPQYWNNLLPRIHSRIEQREKSKLISRLKDSFGMAWKIILPAAAVILIFVIYRISTFNNETPLTVQNQTNIIKDSSLSAKENTVPKENEKYKTVNQQNQKPNKTIVHRIHRKPVYRGSTELTVINNQDNDVTNKEEEQKSYVNEQNMNQEYASNAIDELIFIDSGEQNEADEEIDNELNALTSNEQEIFLKKLSNTNL